MSKLATFDMQAKPDGGLTVRLIDKQTNEVVWRREVQPPTRDTVLGRPSSLSAARAGAAAGRWAREHGYEITD